MRIGIGHPGAKEMVNGYVLHDFAREDRDWIDPLLAAVAEHAPLLAKGDDASFMNRVHLAAAGSDDGAAAPKGAVKAEAAPSRQAERSVGGALATGLRKLLGRHG
jgi:PTH1 family peptidyl-tRNA hydrolase